MPDDTKLSNLGFHECQLHPRTHVLCDALLLCDDAEIHCEILNVSDGGARIQLPEPTRIVGDVYLRFPQGQRLSARIVWQADDDVGLEFLEESSEVASVIAAITSSEVNPKEQRRQPRTSVLLAGQLAIGDAIHDCRVMNLSAGGAKVGVSEPLSCGDRVVLMMDRIGSFDGEVVWTEEGTAGLKFDDDPQLVAGAISRTLPTIKFR